MAKARAKRAHRNPSFVVGEQGGERDNTELWLWDSFPSSINHCGENEGLECAQPLVTEPGGEGGGYRKAHRDSDESLGYSLDIKQLLTRP